MSLNDLSQTAIQASLDTQIIGHPLYYYEQIDSTNTALKAMADQGATEGTVLIANEQTAGRGRFGRQWDVPAGSSLLSSILFRPAFLPPMQGQYLTMICALAAIEVIAAQTGVQVGLKWPNDLVYQERKLGGILTELSVVGQTIDWIVVGLGLNVNVDLNPTHPLGRTATSLQHILGQPISRLDLFQAYLHQVDYRYETLRLGNSPYQDWQAQLVTLGQKVTVSVLTDQTSFQGIAQAVDQTGALLVQTEKDGLKHVLAGEVSLCKDKT